MSTCGMFEKGRDRGRDVEEINVGIRENFGREMGETLRCFPYSVFVWMFEEHRGGFYDL